MLPGPRSAPHTAAAIGRAAEERNTPSQPFAAFTLEQGTERKTPSQPFAAFTLEPPTERSTRSQPFTALASPMVSVGSETARFDEIPSSTAQPAHGGLSAHELLAPELHEATPKGIGAVTISSPAPAIQSPAVQANSVTTAPIIAIATVAIRESAEPERITVESASRESQPATPKPAWVPVKSRPPPRAPVLDDPEGWEAPPGPTATPASADPPPPVAPTAETEPRRADSATRKAAAKAALEKARASKGKIKTSKAFASETLGKRSPSSHSKLLRANSAEAELTGEFFASSLGDQAETIAGSFHEELLDERALRSLSPEVVARRGRYRVVVVLVILGLLLLLGAAIALKMLQR